MSTVNDRSAGSGWLTAMLMGGLALALAFTTLQSERVPLLLVALHEFLGGNPILYVLAMMGMGVLSIAAGVAKWANAHPYRISRRPVYGGFWRRMAAALIDYLMVIPISFGCALTAVALGVDPDSLDHSKAANISPWVVFGLYFAVMESCPTQSTLGKMAMGVRVANIDGGRLGFGRALARQLGKLVSIVPLLAGVIMIAVDPKKRGLHDRLSGSVVINTRAKDNSPPADNIAEHARALLRCAAIFNVLAASQPEPGAVDEGALELRNFFADMYTLHLSAVRGRRVEQVEVSDLLDDELEELERLHASGEVDRSLLGMLGSCGAWQGQVGVVYGTVDSANLEESDFAVVRELLLQVEPPTDAQVREFARQIPRELTESARNSFRLWAQRGYMTPRKGRRELGVG